MNYLKLSKDLIPIINSYNDYSIINMKNIAEKNTNKTISWEFDPDITITDIIFRVLQFGATGIYISSMTGKVNEEFKKKIKNNPLFRQDHDDILGSRYRINGIDHYWNVSIYQLGLIKYNEKDSDEEFILNDTKRN